MSKKEEKPAVAEQPAATAQEETKATAAAKTAEQKQDEASKADEQPDETPQSKVVVVLKRFRDKTDHKTLFVEGQELEFDAERASDVVARGLAKFKDK